jgi:hypothetical protein
MSHVSGRRDTLLLGAANLALIVLAGWAPAAFELPRLFLMLVTLLFGAYLLGTRLVPLRSWIASMAPGFVLALAIQSVLQTILYYANSSLGASTDLWSLGGTAFICHLVAYLLPDRTDGQTSEEEEPLRLFSSRGLIGICLALGALATSSWAIRAAARAATLESIRTPWPLLPDRMLWAIAAGWIALALSLWLVRSRLFAGLNAALAILPTLATIPLIYRIGYGFDGFLHIASEKILLATGTLSPKPLYYIGQYVFTTWLARLSHLPITDIDRWLVPTLAAILLPLAVYLALPERRNAAGFLVLGLAPLGAFIATTPQSLAYLLGLVAIFFAIGVTSRRIHPLTSFFLVAWSITVHPLAGIPFAFVVIALTTSHIPSPSFARAVRILAIVMTGAAIPLLFLVIGMKGGTTIHWNLGSLLSIDPWRDRLASFLPYVGNRFVLWPAWASLAARALPLILLILAIASRRYVLVWSAVALWVSGTILKTTGDFAFLIDYERGNYADRLNTLALLCLIPAAMPAIESLVEKARRTPLITRLTFLTLFVGIASGLAYDALPRNDALVTGRGWSTSQHDLEAVRLIDRDADGREYTVLANQSVSAAAVATLGFKRYAGDVFFYPIPTGGPLYELYLRMTYNEPSRDTARDAALLGKTDLVYVVVNEYWWRAPQLAESLAAIANRDWDIGTGKVRVYRFDTSTPSSASTTTSTR